MQKRREIHIQTVFPLELVQIMQYTGAYKNAMIAIVLHVAKLNLARDQDLISVWRLLARFHFVDHLINLPLEILYIAERRNVDCH